MENNDRKLAMVWWNNLSSLRKTQLTDLNKDSLFACRRWETLTGREIEKVWKKEMAIS
jgi:hypothetical protein